MYGLQLASAGLYSRLVEGSSNPQNVDGTRTVASRLSGPQQTNAELQCCGSSRRKELNDGAVRASSAGVWARIPAAKRSAVSESAYRRPPSWNRFRSPVSSQTLRCTCAPLPAWSGHGFGASEATSPKLDATARIVSRTRICVSAASSTGRCTIDSSCWPCPSST
jgi:hypothetical protein